MYDFQSEVIETWYKNNIINMMILDAIPEEGLEFTTSPRGGGKVGRQFVHLYNVRFWKMERLNKELVVDQKAITKEVEINKNFITELLADSADMYAQLFSQAMEHGGQFTKGHKGGVVSLLSYFLTHEAHHRGNIIKTLKDSPYKLSQELKYAIWDWSKIGA